MRPRPPRGRQPILRATLATAVAAAVFATASTAVAAAQPGVPDPSFGSGGVVQTSTAQLLGVAVQANGEVVTAGQAGGNVFVERFTTAGQPDGTYTGPAGVGRAVAIEPNGDVVIAGSSGSSMLVERLSSSLAPDTSFGSNGIATAFGGQGGIANAVALGPNGQIVAAGSVGNAPTTTASVAEFSSSGGGSGQLFGFGGDSVFSGVTVQPNGQIVVVGKRNPSQAVDALIAWLSSSGGQLGVATLDYPGSGATAFSGVAQQSDGRIVVSGQTTQNNLPAALFARYQPSTSGTLDTSFGTQGITVEPASESLNLDAGGLIGANGIGISGQAGDLVGGGGFAHGAATVDAALWGLSPAGAPDSAFAGGGTEIGPGPDTGTSTSLQACGLAIAPDGSPDAGEIVTVGDRPVGTDQNPCTSNESSNGFVASYGGYGPPPAARAGQAPTATTGAASAVTSTSATVAGTVGPGGLPTTYQFQYGTTTAYGSSTESASAGGGSSQVAVSANLTNLTPGTTYHYRLVASNADGTSYGAGATFTTGAPGTAGAPTVSTGAASSIGEVSAKLHGKVKSNGLPSSYTFQYGTTKRYGSHTASRSLSAGGSSSVSLKAAGLKPGTQYHYRLVATNADGTTYGADKKLKTAPKLSSKLVGVKSSYTIKAVVAHGLTIALTCSRGCSFVASLTIPGATAQQLGLGSRPITIARQTGSRSGAGTSTIVLKLNKAGQQDLAGRKPVAVRLRTVATPKGGGPPVTNQQSIELR